MLFTGLFKWFILKQKEEKLLSFSLDWDGSYLTSYYLKSLKFSGEQSF